MATILVVDDEAEIRELMSRVLAREGHKVDEAAHGAAALDAIRECAYDLVICNIRMPIMDGRELFAHVVVRNANLARRFVFCTGDIISPDLRSFLASAGQPVLTKPFSIAGLCGMVRRALGPHAGLLPLTTGYTEERSVAPMHPW